LQASDFYISASQAEGLPNSVIEARACGLPLILSNIEPHKEFLRDNRGSGILFGKNSLESLLRIIKNINNIKFSKKPLFKTSTRSMALNYQKIYRHILRKAL
jgi:glycosyltransferase involved in cell wall biosynthesis